MKKSELKQIIKEEIDKVISEGMVDRILEKTIAVVKEEESKGNKNDTKALMNSVGKKTGYKVDNALSYEGPTKGMQGFTVGEFAVVVHLADKPKYKSELDKEITQYNLEYTKIGNWWVRKW